MAIREKLGLKPGDQFDFNGNATILIGRRVVDPTEWQEVMTASRIASRKVLQEHPWAEATVSALIVGID